MHVHLRQLAPLGVASGAWLLAACNSTTAPASPPTPGTTSEPAPASCVNPFIGTDDSAVRKPVGGGEGGSTHPGAVMPFGMVQFGPDTPTASPSGYRYGDAHIEQFSLTHYSGAGCPNNEEIGIMPAAEVSASPGSSWAAYASSYAKSTEQARPGYYAVTLDGPGTAVELTATTRSGMARFTSRGARRVSILVNASRTATGSREGLTRVVDRDRIEGYTTGGAFCGFASSGTYPIHFSILFDRDFADFGTFSGDDLAPSSRSVAPGTQVGAYATFDVSSSPVVRMKIGISYVSLENARLARERENPGWDFDAVAASGYATWDAALGRVRVGGGSADDLEQFYTALYHVLQSPNVASDVNGQYMGFDGRVHTTDRTVYQNFSGWDIYRSWAALAALIAPEMPDILQSMVLDGQQGGLLPRWSQQHMEDFIMTGDPGPIVVASGFAFGARDFDVPGAMELMKRTGGQAGATTQGKAPIRGFLPELLERHWISSDASESLEYNASDFAIAQFARRAMNDTATHDGYMRRAQYWANVFDVESGYVGARDPDGSWRDLHPDPSNDAPFTEGNAAQYTWMVPYNLSGLIRLMGGNDTAIQRLDHFFTEVNAGLDRPHFYVGNEPGHGAPWVYNFAGAPWGAQSAVRRTLRGAFSTAPGGLPGNDDLGATSAWFVWAALGMYPVTPGADTLALHGPLFPSATISMPSGKVVQINGAGAGEANPYVQSLKVDGAPVTRSYLVYGDLAGGATLDFVMGPRPNRAWGSGPADAPPSFDDGWSPPPAPPRLGANLARGKAASGPSPCTSGEAAALALDGRLAGGSKYCTGAAPGWLQVDLGAPVAVGQFVVKHAGLGGEPTAYNTRDFRIETSLDATTWGTVVTVDGNRASRTHHALAAPVQARYVRLSATRANQGIDAALRVYELEVYPPPS